jgi:AcrR family transcriptional regulator
LSRRRFSRQDWIALGQEQLASQGPEAVKLDAICKAAGLTRGSFYHHFTDHKTFLIALAEAWLASETEDVAAHLDAAASAADRMAALTDAAMSINYRLELGMRELARRLEPVHAIVARADAMRLDVLTHLYAARFGLPDETARSYAYLEYAAFSGLILLEPDMAPERQTSLAERYADLVERVLGRGVGPEA